MNSLDCRWVEELEFWCERTFTLTADDLALVMRLTFEALDTTADVYLNGHYVTAISAENAAKPVKSRVSGFLKSATTPLLHQFQIGTSV